MRFTFRNGLVTSVSDEENEQAVRDARELKKRETKKGVRTLHDTVRREPGAFSHKL